MEVTIPCRSRKESIDFLTAVHEKLPDWTRNRILIGYGPHQPHQPSGHHRGGSGDGPKSFRWARNVAFGDAWTKKEFCEIYTLSISSRRWSGRDWPARAAPLKGYWIDTKDAEWAIWLKLKFS